MSDPTPKLLDSPLMRHLAMFTGVAFALGMGWNALSADIRQHNRELDTYRASNALALTDIRTRLTAVEAENVRDRERHYEMSNKLTEIQSDLRFLRAQFERSPQPR